MSSSDEKSISLIPYMNNGIARVSVMVIAMAVLDGYYRMQGLGVCVGEGSQERSLLADHRAVAAISTPSFFWTGKLV